VAASYAKVVEVVKSYLRQNKPECLDRVLGGNAQRFWRLAAG
jgi:predicted TIM-barrel fold metal-dependent hydrolase